MPDRVWRFLLAPGVQLLSMQRRIVAGLGLGSLAAVGRLALSPWLMTDFPFILAYPSVAIAAFVGRKVSGLLATAIGLLLPVYIGWVDISHPMGLVPAAIFLINGLFLTGLVEFLHDMRVRLDERYQGDLQVRSEFLARVSHELRTPLNVAMGRVQMLAAGQLPPEQIPRATETALRNLKLVYTLVNDLVEVSKTHTPTIDVVLVPLNLSALLRTIIADIQPQARAAGVTLDCAVQEDLHLQGDAERLRQVISNLLQNAVKFTPAPGHISLTAFARNGQVIVSVVDGGIGIDPMDLPHIFLPFKQGGPAHHRDNTGLGLGLAIVKQLTEAHGGTVQAHSGGRGKGAVFTLVFPRRAPPVVANMAG